MQQHEAGRQSTIATGAGPVLHPLIRAGGLAAALALAAGCAVLPSTFDDRAAGAGLVRGELEAGAFTLRTYAAQPLRPGQRLHIYLDGDGRPWRADPTTARRVVLDLIEQDPIPALLIGRPCYYGMAGQPACRPALWTSGRYGRVVVDALTAAVRAVSRAAPDSPITLIGYSGGGALATLVAPRVDTIDTVVTIAADLDIDAWTSHHGEADLAESLNPAEQPPLPGRIRQVHLAGGRDRNVPAALSARYFERHPGADQLIYPDEKHGCCWSRIWPEVLTGLAADGSR